MTKRTIAEAAESWSTDEGLTTLRDSGKYFDAVDLALLMAEGPGIRELVAVNRVANKVIKIWDRQGLLIVTNGGWWRSKHNF